MPTLTVDIRSIMRASVATQGDTCPHFFVIIYTLSYSFITRFVLVYYTFHSRSLHSVSPILHKSGRRHMRNTIYNRFRQNKCTFVSFRHFFILPLQYSTADVDLCHVATIIKAIWHNAKHYRLGLMVSCDTTLTRFNRDTTGKA